MILEKELPYPSVVKGVIVHHKPSNKVGKVVVLKYV
jgi:hypothetical protein